jgi:alkanesulfonate monooxygenase SsuD/methylene tetrahydromethanopterin reductase-like flavin-dependent oxidoreductase (luciferase family)
MAIGGPDQIAEQVQAKVLDAGVGGAIVNIPNGHEPGVITAVAEALRPLLGM